MGVRWALRAYECPPGWGARVWQREQRNRARHPSWMEGLSPLPMRVVKQRWLAQLQQCRGARHRRVEALS